MNKFIDRKEINNIVLHTIKKDIFKSINISINFRNIAKKEELTIIPFLFGLMTYSTKTYNYKSLIEKKEDLYNLRLNTRYTLESSKYRNDSIDINFIHPNYSNSNIEEEVIKLIKDIIFNPNLDNIDYFNDIKTFINREILSVKNNKREYAKQQLLINMEPDNLLSYPSYGYLEDLEDITIDKLKELYKNIMNNSQIDIVVVGDVDQSKYENYFLNLFNNQNRYEKLEAPIYKDIPKEKEIYIEEKSLNQSKLEIGLRVLNFNEEKETILVNLYRYILGSGPSSKLFLEVREKHSLAYYSSASLLIKPLLIIESGIDGKNYNLTINLIKELLESMKSSSNEELMTAKKTYISSIKNIEYSMNSLSNFYYNNEINKYYELDINKIIDDINKVTIEEIREFSNKIYIDTILLYGVKDE